MSKKLQVAWAAIVTFAISLFSAVPSFATLYDPTTDMDTGTATAGGYMTAEFSRAFPWAISLFGAFLAWRVLKRIFGK